jgi:carbon monoxide dehydrogenase subunit G
MARYQASLDTELPREEVFAYLSDFSTTEEWDPGTVEATRLGEGPIGEGTEFRLLAAFLGRRTELTYRIVEHDPPNSVTLRGENSSVVSLDRIRFEASDGGTRVGYEAELTLKGPWKLADPLLALAFNRVGDSALAGMRQTLASRAATAGRQAPR